MSPSTRFPVFQFYTTLIELGQNGQMHPRPEPALPERKMTPHHFGLVDEITHAL